MKIIESKIIPPKGYLAINLFGVLFVRKGKRKKLSLWVINHEYIHTAQYKELLYLFFVLWYFIEWVLRFVYYRNWHTAYRNISFEREAYANEHIISYLDKRKFWSFLKYI